MDDVMSGYHVGHPFDLKTDEHGMLATAEDVGTFLRALNDGSLFEAGEQEIYTSIYEYEHAGWVPGYQSFAKYHKGLDAVVVAFYSTTEIWYDIQTSFTELYKHRLHFFSLQFESKLKLLCLGKNQRLWNKK
jgi:hypothetical protein